MHPRAVADRDTLSRLYVRIAVEGFYAEASEFWGESKTAICFDSLLA